MLRICKVSTGTLPSPSGGAGGVENTVHHLSLALSELGHEVTMIDVDDPNRSRTSYRVIEVKPIWRDFSNLPSHLLRGLAFQAAVWNALRGLLRNRHFDVVHFHGQLGAGINLRLARAHGVQTVFSSHNATWGDPRLCLSRLQHWKFSFEIDALHRADGVICDSQAIAKNFVSHLGVPQRKLVVVPIGVDEELLEVRPVSESLKRSYSPNGRALLLNVARIAPYKDQLTLVRAMQLVHSMEPTVRLVLVGPASDRRYATTVEREIESRGLEGIVMMTGETSREILHQLYQICDAFVLSSVRESQGLSLIEAMAMSKPVIATAIGPVLEVLPSGVGVIVPPGDPARLSRAILDVLRDRVRSSEMGRRARCHVLSSYRWAMIAERTLVAYRCFGLKQGTARDQLPDAHGD